MKWNAPFKAFAEYWGLEPRVCQPYRAQTMCKIENGVRYVKCNFLPGREFIDQFDFDEHLAEWTAAVGDVRMHGTTHEHPIDRFERERHKLIDTTAQPSFRLQANGRTHRRRGLLGELPGEPVLGAFHPHRENGRTRTPRRRNRHPPSRRPGRYPSVLTGRHQFAIAPEHGTGAIARNARCIRAAPALCRCYPCPDVELRDRAVHDALMGAGR